MVIREDQVTLCGHGSATPSTKNLKDYCDQRYRQRAKNGKPKGVIEVRRAKALTDEGRKQFHDLYKTILGRNIYSQSLRSFVYSSNGGKYYSDCSSSGIATLRRCGVSTSWLYNTAAIHNEDEFETVPVKITNGHITNPEVLKVGDALLFVGEDPSRPLQIGHVEWVYEINTGNKSNKPIDEKIIAGISDMFDIVPENVEVTAAGLNVRETPSSGKVIKALSQGTKVRITRTCLYTKDNGVKMNWGYIKELKGWIALAYTIGLSEVSTYTVTASSLNFREVPKSGRVLSVLKKGTKVCVTKIVEEGKKQWGLALFEGNPGYLCLSGYTTKEN